MHPWHSHRSLYFKFQILRGQSSSQSSAHRFYIPHSSSPDQAPRCRVITEPRAAPPSNRIVQPPDPASVTSHNSSSLFLDFGPTTSQTQRSRCGRRAPVEGWLSMQGPASCITTLTYRKTCMSPVRALCDLAPVKPNASCTALLYRKYSW